MTKAEEDAILEQAAAIIKARQVAATAPPAAPTYVPSAYEEAEIRAATERQAQIHEAAQRKAEAERKQKLEDLRALARLSSPPDPRPSVTGPPGFMMIGDASALITCRECRQEVWGEYILCGIATLCGPCHARHALRCDQCGAHSNVITRYYTDGSFRCDPCGANIQPVSPEQKSTIANTFLQAIGLR
jgi:hypothetical protein